MSSNIEPMGAGQALERLREGNRAYLEARSNPGAIDPELRRRLAAEGQRPYAVVLTCADSRVVPEDIFMTGLGELFTVRVAGNVAAGTQAASVAYAADHLGSRLVVVLGHTNCGAVDAALAGGDAGSVAPVVDLIATAIGDERDPTAAACANARAAADRLQAVPELAHLAAEEGLRIVSALYHTDSGLVEWL